VIGVSLVVFLLSYIASSRAVTTPEATRALAEQKVPA
jgi:hypothetical protein